MSEIIAALIGVAGTMVGVLLTLFGRELIDRLASKRGLMAHILGMWNCNWYVVGPAGDETLYSSDTVKVTKVKGWDVEAEGYEVKGEYVLRGRISLANVLTLLYEGKSRASSLVGAVVMQVAPLSDKMEGKWYGHTREGVLQGGRVIWERPEERQAA